VFGFDTEARLGAANAQCTSEFSVERPWIYFHFHNLDARAKAARAIEKIRGARGNLHAVAQLQTF